MNVILSILLKAIMIYQVDSFTKTRFNSVSRLNMLRLDENENEINRFFRELSGVKSLNKFSGHYGPNITDKEFNFKELHEKYKKMKKLEKLHPIYLHPLENENKIQKINILNGGLMEEFNEFI